MRFTQVFLYFKKKMVVIGGFVCAIRRVCVSIPFKLVDEICCDMDDVRSSIILMKTHPLRQHIYPRLQRLIIAVGIDFCTDRYSHNNNPFLPLKTLVIILPADSVCLNMHGFDGSG